LACGHGLKSGSCCYFCLLPRRVCERLKDLENKDSKDLCVYPSLVRAFFVILELRLEIGPVEPFLTALGIDIHHLQARPGDTVGIVDYLRRPTRLFGTDAIEVCQVFNELSVVKIVQTREMIEDEDRRKRYRESMS
jgi:hypothetical protein